MTKKDPMSFAFFDKGFISFEIRSTIVSMAVFIISAMIIKNRDIIKIHFCVIFISKKHKTI